MSAFQFGHAASTERARPSTVIGGPTLSAACPDGRRERVLAVLGLVDLREHGTRTLLGRLGQAVRSVLRTGTLTITFGRTPTDGCTVRSIRSQWH